MIHLWVACSSHIIVELRLCKMKLGITGVISVQISNITFLFVIGRKIDILTVLSDGVD